VTGTLEQLLSSRPQYFQLFSPTLRVSRECLFALLDGVPRPIHSQSCNGKEIRLGSQPCIILPSPLQCSSQLGVFPENPLEILPKCLERKTPYGLGSHNAKARTQPSRRQQHSPPRIQQFRSRRSRPLSTLLFVSDCGSGINRALPPLVKRVYKDLPIRVARNNCQIASSSTFSLLPSKSQI
jgi:hypothetical protein